MALPFSMSRLWHHVSIPADVDGFVIPSPTWQPRFVHVILHSLSLHSHAVLLPLSSFSLSLFFSLSPSLSLFSFFSPPISTVSFADVIDPLHEQLDLFPEVVAVVELVGETKAGDHPPLKSLADSPPRVQIIRGDPPPHKQLPSPSSPSPSPMGCCSTSFRVFLENFHRPKFIPEPSNLFIRIL